MPEDASDDLPQIPQADPPGTGLVLVSTPIGNLADITLRALEVLRNASLVLCEDTRTTARLFAAYGIATRLAPLHEHNEDAQIGPLLARLRTGAGIALVSDAGTPLLSDPGYRLVRAAIVEGLPVSAVPGANAATMALILSGLPPYPHLFMGFLPPKQAARRTALGVIRAAEEAGLLATIVLHEAPHRLVETLADARDVLGDRSAAVARELTKRFEDVRRASLSMLVAYYGAEAPRGEITLVIGPPEGGDATPSLESELTAALAAGHSLRDAAALVAVGTGLPRKLVYARALQLRQARSVRDDVGDLN